MQRGSRRAHRVLVVQVLWRESARTIWVVSVVASDGWGKLEHGVNVVVPQKFCLLQVFVKLEGHHGQLHVCPARVAVRTEADHENALDFEQLPKQQHILLPSCYAFFYSKPIARHPAVDRDVGELFVQRLCDRQRHVAARHLRSDGLL